MDFFFVDTLRRLKKEHKMVLEDIGKEMKKKVVFNPKEELKK